MLAEEESGNVKPNRSDSNSRNGKMWTASSVPARTDRRSQSMRVSSQRPKVHADPRSKRFGSPGLKMSTQLEDKEMELERMRTFSIDTTKSCVINRGDSFRRRFSAGATVQARWRHGNSSETLRGFTPPDPLPETPTGQSEESKDEKRSQNYSNVGKEDYTTPPESLAGSTTAQAGHTGKKYEIGVVGLEGVGKTSLINQFMTSEYCNPFLENDTEVQSDSTVTIQLDGDESRLTFVEVDSNKDESLTKLDGHGFLVIYSIDESVSFRNAKKLIHHLRHRQQYKPIILVANKIDLERKRQVTAEEGRSVAKEHDCKFVEITVGLGHHIDELLVAILAQVMRNENEEIPIVQTDKEGTAVNCGSPHKSALRVSASFTDAIRSSPSRHVKSSSPVHALRRLSTRRGKRRGSPSKGSTEEDPSLSPPPSCTNLTSVGHKFIQKMFSRKHESKSLEDLLSLP